MKCRAGRGNMDMMVGSLAWPGSGWLWLGVLGLGAVCALTVVTVSTVQTAITRWSPNTPPAQHSHRQPPGLTRSCEINAWLAVPYDSCHHSLHCSLSCSSLQTLRSPAGWLAGWLVTEMVKHQTHYSLLTSSSLFSSA